MGEQDTSEKLTADEVARLRRRITQLEAEALARERTVEALRESHEKYRQLFENESDAVMVFDAETLQLEDANRAALDLLGYCKEEFLSLRVTDISAEEEETKRAVARVIKGEREALKVTRRRFRRKDGTLFAGEISAGAFTSRGRRKIIGAVRDITQREQAHKALRESEEKYRLLFDNAPAGIYEVDFRTQSFVHVNDVICEYTGYSKEELFSMRPLDILTEESRKRFAERMGRILAGEEVPQTVEYKIRGKHGREFWVRLQSKLTYEAGRPRGATVVAHDITEQKLAQEALQAEKEKFCTLVEEAPLGIALIGKDGRYKFLNSGFSKIFGYALGDIPTHREWFEKAYPGPDYRNRVMSTWKRDLEQSDKTGIRERTFRVRCKDGTEKMIHFKAVTLGDGDQLMIYDDVSEMKKLEARLRQSQKMEAIGRLAGGIAHDFNNRLMALQGNISLMLLDLQEDHPARENLKHMEREIALAAKLNRQLLGYARKGRYEVQPLDLNRIVQETSEAFGRSREQIKVHRDLAKEPLILKGDQTQMKELLLDLYEYAAAAMPRGGELFIQTRRATHEDMKGKGYEPQPGNYAVVRLRDTGPGMDQETVEHIFDPFFTAKETGGQGGLGLASAYGVVKCHGGYIQVDTERGRGNTFSIYLPASEGEREGGAERPEQMGEGRGTVLLIDDEPMVLGTGAKMLSRLGYRALTAQSGEAAIELYRTHREEIGLVILDLVLPDMGGGQIYDQIKALNPDVRVLLSSGYSNNGLVAEIQGRGCEGFIQKPFTLKDLWQKVTEIVGRPGSCPGVGTRG